ncbi:plant cysteine oxidase 2 isoform X2 [Amborella trichopoda]|uniref:plant cysteine oxidase 2 isoform X2 n=1 Tax=Amborella trichopoda TaxID=13333 RepID=UPI0005D3DE57|nr:plant cysteine oxidase 2 isoform X2 [Amborella trichopoda]|eukprot:XP_011622510.1 plant cysteine oxidase 2 isoform X2 [Amborella trichopoda]
MRIEIDKRGNSFCDFGPEKKAKKTRRKHKKAMPTAVQRLFEICNDVFAGAGSVPSPPQVERLQSVLDSMKPSDVGLNELMPYFEAEKNEGYPPITYLHVYECDNFSIGIFCLPPSGVIPLHNHPNMTVFSKLLFGSMHIKSFDWAPPPFDAVWPAKAKAETTSSVRLAKVKVDSDFNAPCKTSILYPTSGGNMHTFHAQTACAVLDVFGPPYNDSKGRHCTYFHEFPYPSFSVSVQENGGEYAWLEEIERPGSLKVVGAEYEGPKIVDTL